ncbi:Rbd1 rhomboid-like protein [Scheffersomyces amazonensis]|uniref:Rbd1 rhomboid-like protein n=1 Tax=Scheffersomyces amazonensis TaxID=1078765 RepID=UPI00315DC586
MFNNNNNNNNNKRNQDKQESYPTSKNLRINPYTRQLSPGEVRNNSTSYYNKELPSTNEFELNNLSNSDDELLQNQMTNNTDNPSSKNRLPNTAHYNLMPLPSLPHQSPFEELDLNNNNSHNNNNNINANPFLTPKNDYSYNDNDNIDSPASVEQKMDYYEKERLRILRKTPRFHYTNLPYFTILVTMIQIIVFIVELAKMSILTGSAFQTKPYFNPMLGPSTYLLINMGARYVPCMQQIETVTDDPTLQFPCPNSTSVATNVCSLPQLCGLTNIPFIDNKFIPDQWFRIITPIFLHAGFLHIIFNLLLQITMGPSIERSIGTIKFALIYLASGISGFLLGANFTPIGIASTGASGALFGILATNILLFIYCGKKNTNIYNTKHYGLFILIMVGEILVSLVLGLLPGMDNFSHIGGFAIGILMSILLVNDPFFVYEDGIIPYDSHLSALQHFQNQWNPFAFWSNKIPINFAIWATVRVISLILVIVYFVLLAKNFFTNKDGPGSSSNCHWCKYINCIPVNGWCDIGQISITTSSLSSPSTSASPTTNTNTNTNTMANPSASHTNANEVIVTSTLPVSIVNTESPDPNSQNKFKIRDSKDRDILEQFGIFEDQQQGQTQQQLDQTANHGFVEHQNIGLAFYGLFFILTISFLKRKKIL